MKILKIVYIVIIQLFVKGAKFEIFKKIFINFHHTTDIYAVYTTRENKSKNQ